MNFVYENRRMKPVETVLRCRGEKKMEKYGGLNPAKINCKHACRYHSVSPCTTIIC
jgi:hypothetical protein